MSIGLIEQEITKTQAEQRLEKCKEYEATQKLHVKRINANTIVACKNADRIPLFEKSVKTIHTVQSNENL